MKGSTFLTKEELWNNNNSYWFLRRATNIANFIDEIKPPVGDMGERNPLIDFLEEKLDISASSIDNIDFDYHMIEGKYGTIFCFDILEHLFNPLFALENIKKSLLPNGIIYISIPYRPHFMWTEHHFHEMDDKRRKWLFDRAGLQIVKHKKVPLRGRFVEHLRGIRPLIRYFHKSLRLYKLNATQNHGHTRDLRYAAAGEAPNH